METILVSILIIIGSIAFLYFLFVSSKKYLLKSELGELFEQYIQPYITGEKEKELELSIKELKNKSIFDKSILNEEEIYGIKSKLISEKIANVGKDFILTEEEDQYINCCIEKLDIKLSYEDKNNLEMWREHSRILKGNISPVRVDFNLQKDEVAYFSSNVELQQMKHYKGRGNYAIPYDQLVKLDSGEITLTNKRILFVGRTKNISIKIERIIKFKPYKDCIEVHKGSGNPYYFMFRESIKFFFIYEVLKRGAFNESKQSYDYQASTGSSEDIGYCYELLGLTPSATDEEVMSAYRELAKKHHPDKGGDRHYFSVIMKAKKKILSRSI